MANRGGDWGPVAPAVFKTVCAVPRVRRVGSTPIHLRQYSRDRSMMRIGILLAIFLVLATAPCAFTADGGVLHSTTEQISILGLDRSMTYLESAGGATIDLGGSEPEDVSVFKYGESFQIMVANEEPFRLFHDLNGDGEAQPDEIYESPATPHGQWMIFEGVRILMDVPRGRVPVEVQVSLYGNGGGSSFAQLSQPKTQFRGTIALGGREYDALLFFVSVTDPGTGGNERVILDTDGDGQFEWLTDFWFPAYWGFNFEGNVLISGTEFRDTSAEVTIRPHDGPTASLRIDGEGFHRARVTAQPQEIYGPWGGTPLYDICLEANETQGWELPIGSYSLAEVWLRSSSDESLFWHSQRVGGDKYRVQIAEGDTASLDLGGPLTQNITVSTFIPSLMGRVFVDYAAFSNPDGLQFDPLRRNAEGQKDLSWKPSFEILDGKGQVIASANFEHG